MSVGANEDEELCAEQLYAAMTEDKEKAAILEMFCGESLIDLDKWAHYISYIHFLNISHRN